LKENKNYSKQVETNSPETSGYIEINRNTLKKEINIDK